MKKIRPVVIISPNELNRHLKTVIVAPLTRTLKGYLFSEIVADDAALERAKTFIIEGLRSGELRPVIARTFEFDEIREAHRFVESNEQIGKVVVRV